MGDHRRSTRARRRAVGFPSSAGRFGGGRVGDPRLRLVHSRVGGVSAGGVQEEVELAAVGLVSARPSPAMELSGVRRRRARLAPVRSVLAADLAAGNQSRTRAAASAGVGIEGGFGKVVFQGWRVLAESVHRVKIRRCAADEFCGVFVNDGGILGAWIAGGCRSSSPSPEKLLIFDLVSVSPTYCACLLYFY